MAETSAAPSPAPDTSGEKKPARRRARIVDPGLLQLDPALLNTPLAAWWQRAGGMVVDLVLIGALSLLANPVLGLLTGATLAALGSRRVSDAKFWLAFRWLLIGLGAAVMVLSGFMLIGRPLVKTGAFNLTQAAEAPAIEPVFVSVGATNSELRRAVTQLEKNVEILQQDNTRLRESSRGSSWMNFAADSSRTMGLTFGWAGVYFTLFTAWLRGRTPGKFLFRTRVVRLDGRPLTAMDAFTRNGGYAAGLATGSIGFLRILWDANNQAIQDKIAGTVVTSTFGGETARVTVPAEPAAPAPPPSGA
ncbi:MAG: RDD family protein [Opitutaceae bacterium]|nr:RDD family protein [Opitutaceae bacterium]